MMQRVSSVDGDEIRELALPDAHAEVLPGIRWGCFDALFTPAYWKAQLWMLRDCPQALDYRLGSTLKEEAAACILSGYGITAEMAFAAFQRLQTHGLLDSSRVTSADCAAVLRMRSYFNGRLLGYRFPDRKAEWVAAVLNALSIEEPPTAEAHGFRDWFLRFKGIGYKTASWITRNWLRSSDVAIIDIHMLRFGRRCGLFPPQMDPSRHYLVLERLYLQFCDAIGADSAKLDLLIWLQIRKAGRLPMR